MEAPELARWTRFAAKGGIGKCTAIQDCIAESPEDLMFLKDDEITVLMQLTGQPGRYLGYCEGVVGRFQAKHVRVHGKLKRPVMTKRSSSSAVSTASSPVPSVTPSPRMPPARLMSPTVVSPPLLNRDSAALSDPFDLELEAPSKPRRSEETESFSDGDGGRRRLTRAADELPGLDMFLPRSRSGSRSRPSSRGHTDDEKGARLRTFTPQQSQLASRADSPDGPTLLPPSSPPSQISPSSPEKPDVQIKVVEDAVPVSISPEPLQEESSLEKDVSSLYGDGGSVRSSIYSTQSYRSSVFGAGSASMSGGALDALARLSRSESDDGGLGMGIGLTMLQDLVDDDDEDVAADIEVPPTPRPIAHLEKNVEEGEEAEEEGKEEKRASYEEGTDEEDDDDESYWDGADIYDNYRYSRYSVMTKGSRRKSRFSVISRNSMMDPEPEDVPPIPLDSEGRLRSDSVLSNHSRITIPDPERRKHVPSPLNLVKSNSPSPPPASELLSTSMNGDMLSPTFMPKRSTVEYNTGVSPQPSPLLHTNFPSPRTSSSRATSFGTAYETPEPSPAPSVVSFSGAGGSGGGNGAASALRQRLEHERSASPAPQSSPLLSEQRPDSAEMEREDNAGPGRGIVVEDDEPVNVTVVPADDGGTASVESGYEKDNATRDSVQSAVSEASIASMATSSSNVSDASGVMRRIEADLASVSAGPMTPLPMGARARPSDADGSHTPNSPSFPSGATQPLRFSERGSSRPSLSNDPEIPQSPPPPVQRQQPIQQHQPQPQPQRQGGGLAPNSQLLRPEQAIFLPHPNAPRPNPAVLSGQRVSTYGMPPVHEPVSPQGQNAPAGGNSQANSLQSTLRVAATSRVGPAGVPHRPTIFGKTIIELSSADGPVAMVWSLQPFPQEPVSRTSSPAPGSRAPRRSATAGASPLSQSVSGASAPPSPQVNNFGSHVSASAPLAAAGQPTLPSPLSVNGNSNQGATQGTTTGANVLARPNFSPQVGAARPRSRSFSGFAREPPSKPELKERASEEGNKPSRATSMQSLKDAVRATGGSEKSKGHPLRQSSSSVSAPSRGTHTPSPLSRPQNNAVVEAMQVATASKGAPSPLGRASFSSSHTQFTSRSETASDTESGNLRQPVMPAGRNHSLRQVASVDTFKPGRSEEPLSGPPTNVLQPSRRNSGPTEGSVTVSLPNAASSSAASSSITSSPMQRFRRISSPSSKRHQRTVSQQSQASSTSEARSAVPSPQEAGGHSASSSARRSNSVKSKISLSHLRIRGSPAKESLDIQSPSPSTGPATPVFDFDNQPETINVQDAEFEMIRPTMRRVSSEPTSDDSRSVVGREERPSLQRDSRVDSPVAGSVRSLLSPAQSTVAETVTEPSVQMAKPEDASMHRARELKWMSTMSAVPPAQARKSKKIRRLILEGVPSSVRYLVWSHLTDSKAKRIPGVYGQIGKRGRVAASEIIERDASRCFPDQPHLRDPKGPLVGLLQTYLTMVPDVEYQTSLALVAGHLLLQSPEEDAFWTFISMLDLHLRAYFSSKSVQMEADAMIFGKAVESLNPHLAKKLFVDMSIPPLEICRTWFSSLFATTLPQDYVNRVWDVYLCEGPVFLFRVGLAIISCSRSAIEASRDRSAILSFLARPETMSLLPGDPEELITIALALKLKDDDVRKQRVKVEAQLRQQTQTSHRGAPRLASSISLPRAGPSTPI